MFLGEEFPGWGRGKCQALAARTCLARLKTRKVFGVGVAREDGRGWSSSPAALPHPRLKFSLGALYPSRVSRETRLVSTCRFRHIERFFSRSWLMQLWGLVSPKSVEQFISLRAGEEAGLLPRKNLSSA